MDNEETIQQQIEDLVEQIEKARDHYLSRIKSHEEEMVILREQRLQLLREIISLVKEKRQDKAVVVEDYRPQTHFDPPFRLDKNQE